MGAYRAYLLQVEHLRQAVQHKNKQADKENDLWRFYWILDRR